MAHQRTCALCGRRIPPSETAIYSRFTKSHYCGPRKEALCQRRQKQRKKEEK